MTQRYGKPRWATGNRDRALERELRKLGVPVAHSAWEPNPPPATRGHAQGGKVKRLTPAEIALAYPGTPYKPPVRFGPRR